MNQWDGNSCRFVYIGCWFIKKGRIFTFCSPVIAFGFRGFNICYHSFSLCCVQCELKIQYPVSTGSERCQNKLIISIFWILDSRLIIILRLFVLLNKSDHVNLQILCNSMNSISVLNKTYSDKLVQHSRKCAMLNPPNIKYVK